ncbi:MAG: ABC transporter ATP-binding protein [Bdellovibrionales bacterium]|nr:ABC transporter ATP-binding protein [Bdellovibrionales bacterium]
MPAASPPPAAAAFASVRRFTSVYARPLWVWYAGGLAALGLTNWLTLRIPQLARDVVNGLGAGAARETLGGLATAVVALGLAQILIRSLSRILMFWPGRTLEARAKSDLFARMMAVPQSFYDRFAMGDLISRMANDMGQVRVYYAFGALMAANLVFLSVLVVVQMTRTHLTLTVMALAPLALMLLITRWAMPAMHRLSRLNQEALGALTQRATEAFVNVHVIQVNSAEAAFLERTGRTNDQVYSTALRLSVIQTVVFPLMTLLAGLSQLSVLFYGGAEIVAGRLTIGDILVFNVYIASLTFPLTALGIVIAVHQRTVTALKRLNDIESSPVEAARPGGSAVADARAPLLELRSLSFSYPEAPFPAIQDLSFTLNEGGKLGLCGPVGSGKSTLFQLITRIVEPPPGTILLRGRDVLGWDPSELRREVGYALQSAHLFSDTVEGNLRMGIDPQVPLSELEAAARDAEVLDEILRLEQGWQTQIGERGVRLSGGQKQRLALARAFLRRPPLLLLDDVLSAVDQSTERRLADAIRRRSRTLILCSHRPGSLAFCDQIIELDRGRIVRRNP